MPKDLNIVLNFKIKSNYVFSDADISAMKNHPITNKDDWFKGYFKGLRERLKGEYYWFHKRRCAYCRKVVYPDASYEPIDHIIPRKHHKGWTFKLRNLVLSCTQCNAPKNDENTLANGHPLKKFPKQKGGFKIFNPHFESWGNFFRIEDDMFLVINPNPVYYDKAKFTYDYCDLSRYNLSVIYAEEANVSGDLAIIRALKKQRFYKEDSDEFKEYGKLISHYVRLLEEN